MSNKTAEIVDSCPDSLNEMTKRAKVKNCEEHSRNHNCTGSKPYVYHCVINELKDAFVEVCAPNKFINIGKMSFKIIELIFIFFCMISITISYNFDNEKKMQN